MNVALLIDAENIDRTILPEITTRLSVYGNLIVKRAYGDWGTPNLRGWKSTLMALDITPIQQFSYTPGKNAADIALVIDAMDLLYQGQIDIFAFASNDSDFTKLASRLKESHKKVVGFGTLASSRSLKNACHTFITLSSTNKSEIEYKLESDHKSHTKTACVKSRTTPTYSPAHDRVLIASLVAIVKRHANEDGWAPMSVCGSTIKRCYPKIQYKEYACKTLVQLFENTHSFLIMRPNTAAEKEIYVRNNLPHIVLSLRKWI